MGSDLRRENGSSLKSFEEIDTTSGGCPARENAVFVYCDLYSRRLINSQIVLGGLKSFCSFVY